MAELRNTRLPVWFRPGDVERAMAWMFCCGVIAGVAIGYWLIPWMVKYAQ